MVFIKLFNKSNSKFYPIFFKFLATCLLNPTLSSQRKLLLQQLPMSRQFLFFMSFRLFNSKRSVFSQSLSMRNRLHFRLRGWLHCLQRKLRLILFRMQRKLPPLSLPLQNSKWNLFVSVLRLFRLHFL